MTITLSALDLAVISDGMTSADALAATTTLAQRAEAAGYARLWVAEHHNMPTVASTSPGVLIAHLAAMTSHIRLGSGGVMLPNHAPLVVAEQFAMLEALHPGRIDLGIGRAPGTDPATAAALRRDMRESGGHASGAEDFPRDLLEVMALLGDDRTGTGAWRHVRATPVPVTTPWVALLGSSDYSAQLAGLLGLPFSFAHHFDMTPRSATVQAFDLYRRSFRPSPVLEAPYAIVTANVLAAATDEQAQWLAGPGRLLSLLRRTSGRFTPISSPEAAAAHPGIREAEALATTRIVGDARRVADQLEELAADTGAAEVMISTVTYGIEERATSLELIAGEWRRRFAQPVTTENPPRPT